MDNGSAPFKGSLSWSANQVPVCHNSHEYDQITFSKLFACGKVCALWMELQKLSSVAAAPLMEDKPCHPVGARVDAKTSIKANVIDAPTTAGQTAVCKDQVPADLKPVRQISIFQIYQPLLFLPATLFNRRSVPGDHKL